MCLFSFRPLPAMRAVLLVLIALASVQFAAADEKKPADLQAQMIAQAPKILDYLRGKGYKTVGVLKFRVKKGADPISDSVGALNSLMADRLEIALIMKDSLQASDQIGIIHKASDEAAKLPGATHLTPEGRKTLFEGKYKLAWGDQAATPDVFITGLVQITPDLHEMSINLLAFGRDGGALEKVIPPFQAPVDAASLSELGESFVLRGGFDGGNVKLTETAAVETAYKIKAKEASFPLSDRSAPVTLEIYYDGKLAPIDYKSGQAKVAEPNERQQIAFRIRRNSADGRRYAVVLKVNGENTLFREKDRDLECKKWILEKDVQKLDVIGFQLDKKQTALFKVLSRHESQKSEMYYGNDVGLISLTVFVEQTGMPPAGDIGDDEADMVAVKRGGFPEGTAGDLGTLRSKLALSANELRGVVVDGEKTKHEIQIVQFTPNPTPAMSVVIRYYKP